MLKIALLGLADSCKTELALVLAAALRTAGSPAVVMQFDKTAPASDLASHDLVLLMGLQSAALARPAQETEVADQQIRAALDQARISYRVIYGLGQERLHQALQACSSALKPGPPPVDCKQTVSQSSGKKAAQWAWMCDKCSNPACEHRLLSDLLSSRSAKG